MRAHVTPELVAVVKNRHYKRPSMTQKELAEKVGCSAATVGRILAGKYDKDCKRTDKDELYSGSEKKRIKNFILDNTVKDLEAQRDPEEPQKPDMDEVAEKLDYSIIMDYLNYIDKKIEAYGRPNPNPMSEERFRQLIATEIITLRQTQVDMYKEIKQLKGILAEIRDIWKK